MRINKAKRVRVLGVVYFTALMTFLAPVSPVHSPEVPALADAPDFKQFARTQMAGYGWNETHFNCLAKLWGKESAWNPKADNPTSTAFGIAQMINETSTSPVTQISNGLRYISFRYENPCNAWSFWQKRNWY